jgi:hypothetical protein
MFERRLPLLVCIVIIVLICLPYFYAGQMESADTVFGGFLINPLDGHSYLAKMQQGYQGGWQFVLPYTAESNQGSYLFLFYLGLGHLARIINLPLLSVFHGARVLGAVLLLWVLNQFSKKTFLEQRHQSLFFAICAIGSGLGWIAVIFGRFTSDFWVAEAYPFLSMYTNPHFTIGLALMIFSLIPDQNESLVGGMALGFLVGIIQPFAVVIVILVKAGRLGLRLWDLKNSGERLLQMPGLLATAGFAVGGGMILVYQYWTILTDPVLSLWNAQNLTESPDLVDLLFSFSPCLLLAFFGLKSAWKAEHGKTLVIWAAACFLLVFLPWNLQRRFLTGIFIPLAGLAVYGLKQLDDWGKVAYRTGAVLILVLVVPTNLIILLSGVQAASNQDQKIYYPRDLYDGVAWIAEFTPQNALVLTDKDTGLIIPSLTGRRVIYGHPFETVNAEIERRFVTVFFTETQEDRYYQGVIAERSIDVIFLTGEISTSLEKWINLDLEPAYQNDQVRIYLLGQ